MSEWMYNLPVAWMAIVVFLATYAVTACVYALVMAAAKGERVRAFKAVSPGMLPPLGIIFGLFVAFLAAQVWSDLDRAQAAVSREASALRGPGRMVRLQRSGSSWLRWKTRWTHAVNASSSASRPSTGSNGPASCYRPCAHWLR